MLEKQIERIKGRKKNLKEEVKPPQYQVIPSEILAAKELPTDLYVDSKGLVTVGKSDNNSTHLTAEYIEEHKHQLRWMNDGRSSVNFIDDQRQSYQDNLVEALDRDYRTEGDTAIHLANFGWAHNKYGFIFINPERNENKVFVHIRFGTPCFEPGRTEPQYFYEEDLAALYKMQHDHATGQIDEPRENPLMERDFQKVDEADLLAVTADNSNIHFQVQENATIFPLLAKKWLAFRNEIRFSPNILIYSSAGIGDRPYQFKAARALALLHPDKQIILVDDRSRMLEEFDRPSNLKLAGDVDVLSTLLGNQPASFITFQLFKDELYKYASGEQLTPQEAAEADRYQNFIALQKIIHQHRNFPNHLLAKARQKFAGSPAQTVLSFTEIFRDTLQDQDHRKTVSIKNPFHYIYYPQEGRVGTLTDKPFNQLEKLAVELTHFLGYEPEKVARFLSLPLKENSGEKISPSTDVTFAYDAFSDANKKFDGPMIVDCLKELFKHQPNLRVRVIISPENEGAAIQIARSFPQVEFVQGEFLEMVKLVAKSKTFVTPDTGFMHYVDMAKNGADWPKMIPIFSKKSKFPASTFRPPGQTKAWLVDGPAASASGKDLAAIIEQNLS